LTWCKDKATIFSGIISSFEIDNTKMTLQKKLINRVIAMSPDQLSTLEKILNKAPFGEIDTDADLVNGIIMLQEKGGAFDFLNEEPEIYSAMDCQYIYNPISDQLTKN
jgi:hypothetical protein